MWLIAFFFFLFHAWSGAVWGEEGTKKKKRKEEERREKSPLTASVCAQEKGTRLRLHLNLVCIFPPDRSGSSRRTDGPYRDYIHWQHKMWRRCACLSTRSCFLFETGGSSAQREKSLPGSFFLFFFFFLRSCLTRKWDSGYAASPVE